MNRFFISFFNQYLKISLEELLESSETAKVISTRNVLDVFIPNPGKPINRVFNTLAFRTFQKIHHMFKPLGTPSNVTFLTLDIYTVYRLVSRSQSSSIFFRAFSPFIFSLFIRIHLCLRVSLCQNICLAFKRGSNISHM